jgi:hypothetical protein
MEEELSDYGDVYVKATREEIGRFSFSLRHYQRPGSALWHTDLEVDLPATSARRFLVEDARLVLRVPDGRCQDFSVSGVSGSGAHVRVTPTGGLRTEDTK